MAETTLRELLRLAEDDIGASRPADALTHCRHILAHYPDMLEARRVLGEAYLAMGKTKEAYQAFDRILISDPENTLAYCNRALISEQLNDLDAALDCYYQACELSLGNRQLRLEFRRLALQANQPDFVLSRVGLARLYMRGDLLAHAIREWEQVLQGDPERIDARLGLAEALWRDGQPEWAAEECRLILEAMPTCLKAQLLLGEIAYRSNQNEDARHYLERARRQDPDGRMARELFADALIDDTAFTGFMLSEPARIPVMGERSGAGTAGVPTHPISIILPNPERQMFDERASVENASVPPLFAAHGELTFPFLAADAPAQGTPLQEGESLEQMLASLIERPMPPPTPGAPLRGSTHPLASPQQPADRLQALLMSFGPADEAEAQRPPTSASDALSPASLPVAPTFSRPVSAASDVVEGLVWSETGGFPTMKPSASSLAALAASGVREGEPGLERPRTSRPRGQNAWGEEEDTEAGWLRWLQAQGARPFGELEDAPETGSAFAALLRPAQEETPRASPWEAPDLDFVRAHWPTDTVPQPAVRLTAGTSAKLPAITKRDLQAANQGAGAGQQDTITALGGISSVSLRPLTLQELEQTFSVSGLRPAESVLPGGSGERISQPLGLESGASQPLVIAEDDYSARMQLAERQRRSGNLAEALGHYRAVIRGAPELVDRVIGSLLASTGAGPEQAAVYRLLGDAYTRRGDYMEALEAYNRGLAVSRGH